MCELGFNCFMVILNKIGVVDEEKVKVCLFLFFCWLDYVCSNSNEIGDVVFCNLDCCGFDECNVELFFLFIILLLIVLLSIFIIIFGNESIEI